MSYLKNSYVSLEPISWCLCLSSTIAGTAVRSSAMLALTTNCPFRPRPSRWECVTHAMLSCSSAVPPPPPKWTTGKTWGLPHYSRHTLTPRPQQRLQTLLLPSRGCSSSSSPLLAVTDTTQMQLKSKMADHWFQVSKQNKKKKKKKKKKRTFTFSSVLCLSQDNLMRLHFLAAGYNQDILKDWTFLTWSTNTSL